MLFLTLVTMMMVAVLDGDDVSGQQGVHGSAHSFREVSKRLFGHFKTFTFTYEMRVPRNFFELSLDLFELLLLLACLPLLQTAVCLDPPGY